MVKIRIVEEDHGCEAMFSSEDHDKVILSAALYLAAKFKRDGIVISDFLSFFKIDATADLVDEVLLKLHHLVDGWPDKDNLWAIIQQDPNWHERAVH